MYWLQLLLINSLIILGTPHIVDSFGMAYRIRNPLIRSVVNRMYTDEEEKARDHSQRHTDGLKQQLVSYCDGLKANKEWYKVRLNYLPETFCDKFVECHQDAETGLFLEQCFEKGEAVFTQMYHTLAKSVLTWFMSSTSANGLLRRGSMYIFSKAQVRSILGVRENWMSDKLLDLGAGDGKVTQQIAPLFREVSVTEMSTTMNWRLSELGYNVVGVDAWQDGTHHYDLISCLNLLDRCDKPMTLLREIRKALTPKTGRVLVATVIPFTPYIEYTSDHKPSEFVNITGESFEEQVNNLIKHMFEPSGFMVERFSRLPYLCEGDLERSFYVLDDAVFVLRPS